MKVSPGKTARTGGNYFVRSMNSWYLSDMKKIALIISLVTIFWFSDAAADTWTGEVVGVRDGDVIRVSHAEKGIATVMLYGVDAPDKGQPFFRRSRKFLKEKLEGQKVSVRELVTDQKIITAVIIHEGVNINEELLKAGYGWVSAEYCREDFCGQWLAHEKQARNSKVGLWQDEDPVPPWEWRKKALTKIFRIFLWVLPPWSN